MFKALIQKEKVVVWSLFILLVVGGLSIIGDFSISSDEVQQRNIGMVSLRYIAGRHFPLFLDAYPDLKPLWGLHDFWDKDYGVMFELPLAWLERVLGITEWRSIFLFRHVCTFFVSLGGVVAVYQLARRRFGDWRIGLLGATMLVLSPRIFGEMFYNNKDVVFMALFAIATNTAVRLIARPSWGRVFWHALACTCAIDVRIMGILLPAATLAFLGLQAARGAYKSQRYVAGQVVLYMGLVPLLVFLCWPFLWESPVQNFVLALSNMAKARWLGEILYAGEMVWDNSLPWHYAEVWIGVTTPVLYLIGFLIGAGLIGWQVVRSQWRLYTTAEGWQDLLFLGLLVLPLLAVIVTHSILYNAWRQLYFVYPSLLLVSLRGLVAVGRWRPDGAQAQRWYVRCSYAALLCTFLLTAGQLVALHPLQATYFNVLAGRHVEGRFDIDYWVMSYQDGLRWVAEHDDRPHIIVSSQRKLELEYTRKMLPPYYRDRLEVVEDPAKSEYFLTTYYGHPQSYEEYDFELASIRRGGQRILSIFRTKWQPKP